MMVPKVSVILPNYNGEKYLKQAIQSVLNQSFRDFELIIVDDASSDASRDIIKGFDDERIITHFSEKNRHVVFTFNTGMKLATGEYIARIDSDDIWEPDKLEKQVAFMEQNPEYGVCFSRVHIIDEHSEIADDKYEDIYNLFNATDNMSQKQWVLYFFYVGNCLCNSSSLIRKSALETVGAFYNMAFMPGEDFELWGRLAVKYPIYISEEWLVKYRWTEEEGKISGKNNGREYAFLNVHMLFRKNYLDYMTNEEFVRYFGEKFVNKYSESSDELECEKAQILLRCSEINTLGIERYGELLRNPNMLDLLEDRYQFSLPDFYKEYMKPNYYYVVKNEMEQLKQENHILNLEQEKLSYQIKEKNQMIDTLVNSTSWKITEPLRKAGRLVKGNKALDRTIKENVRMQMKRVYMKRIYIHAYTAGNLGDDLLIRILCERYPQVLFLIYADASYKERYKDIHNLKVFSPGDRIVHRVDEALRRIRHINNGMWKLLIKTSYATVHIGGSVFVQHQDDFSEAYDLDYQLRRLSKRMYVVGANFGPYTDENYYHMYRELLKKYDGICFRDHYSQQLFSDYDNVRYAPDVVFNYRQTIDCETKKQVLFSVIYMDSRGGKYSISQYSEDYYNAMAELAEEFVERGFKVKFVSFCKMQEDEKAIEIIIERMKEEYQDSVSTHSYVMDEKECIKQFYESEIVVGTRFNSIILGWLAEKKVLPIVYDKKTLHTLEDLKITDYIRMEDLGNMDVIAMADHVMEQKTLDVEDLKQNAKVQFADLDKLLM